MIKRFIAILIIISAVYGGFKWIIKDKTNTSATAATLSVTVVSPQPGTISKQLKVTGITVPREEIVVITELSSVRVKEVFADVGDVVEKGQKLAILDGESLVNQLTQLQSNYDRASDEFKRFDAIKNTGAVSRESVTQKLSTLQAAKAKLDDARLNLKRTTIIAPEAGIIFERKASIGALINASEPLYRIAQYGNIEVEVNVPEADLHDLRIGQDSSIHLTGASAPIQGKIRLVAPRIDSETRTANIRISIPKDHSAPVGLFANANITTGKRQGIILPATAIQQDNSGGIFVWKLDSLKKAICLPVTVVLYDKDLVMIEDIPTDISVIARAGAFIKEGDMVNVVEGK
jgi:HlyD family secretion protein